MQAPESLFLVGAMARRGGTVVTGDMAKHISVLGHALSMRGAQKAPNGQALASVISRTPISFREFVRARIDQFTAER